MKRKILFAASLLLAAATAAFLLARRAPSPVAAPDCGSPTAPSVDKKADLLSIQPEDACGPGALLPRPH